VRRVLTAGVLLALVLGGIGQLVRDRSPVLGFLFYLPLVPLGLWAVVQDLVFAGRCLPRARFALALLGLAVTAASAGPMIALGPGSRPPAGRPVARLLHWNVHWGGGDHRSEATWESLMADIRQRGPDLVVLSEAPGEEWTTELADSQGWSFAQCQNEPNSSYWYKLVVYARGPVRLEYHEPVPNGHVMSVAATVQGRPCRLLVVDGESDPWLSRVALLEGVLEHCRRGGRAGAPIDLLAGDFNTPSRSVGFDPFADGYRLASRAARGWRGTFPSVCPLYDIDHVWVRRDWEIQGCELFTNPDSDHRGQVVDFLLPEGR
jgi:endonuclease/exonuclease/phosphatase (EEP) superfamily protein YafD